MNASNFRSDLSAGIMFRYGSELSQSMGAADISVERPFNAGMMGNTSSGWFLFSGITGRYRFNDLSIEGERSGIPSQVKRSMSHYNPGKALRLRGSPCTIAPWVLASHWQ